MRGVRGGQGALAPFCLHSVSSLRVCAWEVRAVCVRAVRCGAVRESGRRVRGARRVWPGVTARGEGRCGRAGQTPPPPAAPARGARGCRVKPPNINHAASAVAFQNKSYIYICSVNLKNIFWCLWKARGTFYLFQNKMAVISIMNCTLLKVQCAGFSGVLKPTKSKTFLSLPQISRNSSRLWSRTIVWCTVEELSVKCWIILFFSITTSKMTHLSVMIWAIWANKIWKVSHLISIQVRWALNQKLASKKSLMCTFCWLQNNRSS